MITGYKITASALDNGTRVDANDPATLGDALGAIYPTEEEAIGIAEELGDTLEDAGLPASVEYEVVPVEIRRTRDPELAGREDCDDDVGDGFDPVDLASHGAGDALLTDVGRAAVLRWAGGGIDHDSAWEAYGVPWLAAYQRAYAERARELAEKRAGSLP